MKTKKQKLTLFLKTFLGLALVAWVLKGKMVDFSILSTFVLRPVNLVIAFGFLSTSAVLCTLRWRILVRGQGLHISFKDLFSLTMIGNFFNTFMPGSVGGDFIKAWYIAGKEPTKRTKAVFTVLLDRVLGLAVIIFYAAFTLVFFSDWLKEHRQLQTIAFSIWIFSGVSILGGFVFFLSALVSKGPLSKRLEQFVRRFNKTSKILEAAFLYRKQPIQIFAALALSSVSILSAIYFHSLQGKLLGLPLSLTQYFILVPLAVTASAVPLLPGGIGTGQLAFFTLFQWMGIENPELGGTLCTLVQIYTILFNCVGYLFYLRFKQMPQRIPSSQSENSHPSGAAFCSRQTV